MGTFYYFGHVKGKQPTLDNKFYTHVLPTMFVAAIIWFFSTLYFAGMLGTPALDLSTFQTTEILIALGIFLVIWILLIIFTFLKVNIIAMILFFIAAAFNGIMFSFLVDYVGSDIGDELATTLFTTSALIAVFATGGAMLLGFLFKDKIAKHFCWYFLLFGILYALFEIVVQLIFGTGNLVIDFLMLGYIFGVMIFDSATIPGKIKRGFWMMAVIDIFFDFVAMVLRIFIILSRLTQKKKK